jgi:putative ABC transport system permease protein
MKQILSISGYLALKETWRNRGRFLLVSLVIALITLLVLFIAALGEGLGNGNREFISKLNAQLIVYQAKSDLLIQVSRLGSDRLAAVRSVQGVADAGPLGTASASLVLPKNTKPIKVALIGIEPGHTGEPQLVKGQQLNSDQVDEVIIDRNTAIRSKLALGDSLTIRVTQGTEDAFFILRVVGITSGQQYSLQPSIFVPFNTWDRIPGYSAQQSTLNTQGGFTLFIGILVIGGFFQIQVLQKVAQIGVLKAIGTANPLVAAASVFQIVVVTVIGVVIGGLLTFMFSLFFPPTVPIVFNGTNFALAIAAMLLIGPLGGLVSIRHAVRIEPLKALGLSS